MNPLLQLIARRDPSRLSARLAALPVESIGRRLARGSFWSLAGAAVSRVLGLAASVVVARVLGQEDFGRLGMIQSTVGLFGAFAGFGMGMTATRHIAEYRRAEPERAGRMLALCQAVAWASSALMAAGLAAAAPWLAARALGAPELGGLVRLGSLLLLLGGVTGAQAGALAGFEAFRAIARVNLFAGLATFPLMIGGVLAWGLSGAVWALVAAAGINWWLGRRELRAAAAEAGVPAAALADAAGEWPVVLKFGIPAVLAGAVLGPATWGAGAMLVNSPGGFAGVGVFNAVLRIKQLPEMILGMLMGPLLPILSETYGARDERAYNRTTAFAFGLSLLVIGPAALVQAAAPALTVLPYGAAYAGHAPVVEWLMLHGILVALYSPMGSILASMGRMWFGFAYNLAWAVAYLGLAAGLVPRYGAAGLAAAYALAQLTTSLPCLAYIYRRERAFIHGLPLASVTAAALLLFGLSAATGCAAPGTPAAAAAGALAAAGCGLLAWRLFRTAIVGPSRPAGEAGS